MPSTGLLHSSSGCWLLVVWLEGTTSSGGTCMCKLCIATEGKTTCADGKTALPGKPSEYRMGDKRLGCMEVLLAENQLRDLDSQ